MSSVGDACLLSLAVAEDGPAQYASLASELARLAARGADAVPTTRSRLEAIADELKFIAGALALVKAEGGDDASPDA